MSRKGSVENSWHCAVYAPFSETLDSCTINTCHLVAERCLTPEALLAVVKMAEHLHETFGCNMAPDGTYSARPLEPSSRSLAPPPLLLREWIGRAIGPTARFQGKEGGRWPLSIRFARKSEATARLRRGSTARRATR
jgi:hypothetical protein